MHKQLIYDVGLHKGEDTEYYLARGHRVIAIEADPDLVLYCTEKFRKELKAGDLKIFHGAIVEDDSRSSVSFYKNIHNSVWGTVSKAWADRNRLLGTSSIEIKVPVVNFLDIISSSECPYYMKIDIEGMDLTCLEKLHATHLRPRFISIESEKTDFGSLVKEFEILTSLGYKKFFIKQQANISSDLVPTRSVEGKYVNYKFPKGSTGLFGTDLGTGWLSKQDAIEKYRKIYLEYKFFGDTSIIRKIPTGKNLLNTLSKFSGRPLPGWYDTHAMLF